MKNKEIIMYGADWCGDCILARKFFEKHGIKYTYLNIDHDEKARELVERLNDGFRSIPTILLPDGKKFVEPSLNVLSDNLPDFIKYSA